MSVSQPTSAGDVCLYPGNLFATARHGVGALNLPGVRRIAARGDELTLPVSDAVSFVCWTAGLDEEALPIAAACRFADTGETDAHCWLRAEPVHMQPAQDSLRLMPAPPPDAAGNGSALLDAIGEHLALDGWRLQVAGPRDWYLRAPRPLTCVTTPPERVAGRDVFEFMPRGEDGRLLRSLINDVQMLMHNQDPGDGGSMPVNSVWPWGQGRWSEVPATPGRPVAAACSSHPLVRGLWRHWNIPCLSPNTARDALSSGDAGLLMPEFAAGEQGLQALERDWLAPLLGSLSDGRIRSLTLVLATGRGFRVTRRSLRRFWRRSPTVEDAVAALGGSSLA